MSELKQSYASVDEKIGRLNQTISGRDKEISELKKQHQQTEKELKSRNSDVKKLEEKIDKLQWDVSSLQGGSIKYPTTTYKKKFAIDKNLLIIILASFFVVLLIAVLVYLLMGNFGGKDREKELQDKVEILSKENNKLQEKVNDFNAKQEFSSRQGFTISIIQGGKKKNEVDGGGVYVFSLEGNDAEKMTAKGKWQCPAFKPCQKDYFMAKRDSAGKTCKIAFVVDGKEIASKNIKIKED